jgi:hypothetical protein
MFKKLLDVGDRYAKESTWKDFALLKVCIFPLGVIFGTLIPKRKKKKARAVSAAVFAAAYVPLMAKLIKIVLSEEE